MTLIEDILVLNPIKLLQLLSFIKHFFWIIFIAQRKNVTKTN